MAQAKQTGVLSQAAAVAYSNKLGMTLPDAVKAGYLKPAEVPGTYVVTESGASAVGVPVAGGPLSALQITAIVAGVLGLTLVTIDFLDDDDDGASPTLPPTPTATPTQTAPPTNPPTNTTTSTTST
ncbi:MAG TPA: hypothetical protein VGE51_01130 [Fontimonas sp.]